MALIYNHCTNNNSYVLKTRFEKTSGNNYILKFNSPYKTGIPENDQVYAELYSGSGNKLFYNKRSGNKTLILILHGFGTRFKKLINYHNLIKNILSFDDSCTCALLNLPFHLNRMPLYGKNSERLSYFFNEKLKFFHQAICDTRTLIDITTGLLSFNKIIVCGFSLGCMLSVITMALDERISNGILLFGGGNWNEINHKSILRYRLKYNCFGYEKKSSNGYKKACKLYPEFLAEIKKNNMISKTDIDSLLEIESEDMEIKRYLLIDPLSFAHKIDSSKVIMINSRFDHYFTKKSINMLWEGLGKPELHWMNRLHRSSILSNKKVLALIRKFINN